MDKVNAKLNAINSMMEKGAKTNFFIFGDIQTDNTANLSAAIERVKASDPKYAFGIQTGDGILVCKEVQLEGKKRMPAGDFLRGISIEAGTVLGDM